MQKDIPFQLNRLNDEQAVLGVTPIAWGDPTLIVYAIGWPDFEGYMQKWSKTLLRWDIKEDNKTQSPKREEEKGCSSPETSGSGEVSFIDNATSELFNKNLKHLVVDLDWAEAAQRFDETLKIDQLWHSGICKICIL